MRRLSAIEFHFATRRVPLALCAGSHTRLYSADNQGPNACGGAFKNSIRALPFGKLGSIPAIGPATQFRLHARMGLL